MELITQTFTAGEVKEFRRGGNYFEIIDSVSAVDVFFFDKNGHLSDNMRAGLSGLFVEGDYSAFTIRSALAQTLTIMTHEGRGGSRRQSGNVVVSGGSVGVTEPARVSALAGESFAVWGLAASAAAQFPTAQVWNPVGSGRRLIVDQLTVTISVAGSFAVGQGNTQLSTPGVAPQHKNSAFSAAPVALLRSQVAVSDGQWLNRYYANAIGVPLGTSFVYRPPRPIVVAPGWGICVQGGNTSSQINVNFEWDEIP